ncbi:STAS domain-containing protein [Streptomyces buecherae]|uniref:STAS domain-containing protein n=1 Tax=Streptomyces buecherae TaxID=2763006 RepID=A0A7H8NA59_9ACTN|nr:STAS domain-containing protein [Streptomyces buecherae]QKW51333.1 STAS domain-containing protein [Streptomyces buecherae]
MLLPQFTVNRRDRSPRALITLAGEIDLVTAPLVRVSLERCLLDGMRAIDIDLASVTFCDCSGLNAFLRAAQQTTAAGGTLRLHHPPPTLVRIVDLTDCGSLLIGLPLDHALPPLGDIPDPSRSARPLPTPSLPMPTLPAQPHRSASLAPGLPSDTR